MRPVDPVSRQVQGDADPYILAVAGRLESADLPLAFPSLEEPRPRDRLPLLFAFRLGQLALLNPELALHGVYLWEVVGIGGLGGLDDSGDLVLVAGFDRHLDHAADRIGQLRRGGRGTCNRRKCQAERGGAYLHGDFLAPQSRSRQPVLKMIAIIVTQTARNASVMASETTIGKSDVPVNVHLSPLTR